MIVLIVLLTIMFIGGGVMGWMIGEGVESWMDDTPKQELGE